MNNDEIPLITISNNLIINTWSIENEINHTKFNALLIKLEKEYIMIGSGFIRRFRPNENDENRTNVIKNIFFILKLYLMIKVFIFFLFQAS